MYLLKYELGYMDCDGGFTQSPDEAKMFLDTAAASLAWRVKAAQWNDRRRAEIVDTRTGELTQVQTTR